jgi:hypothetical protein
MKLNKLTIATAILATIGSSGLLSGCAAPQTTAGNNGQAQHQDASFSVYPDNRVIFETFLNGHPNYYAWTKNDGDVIVFKIKNHQYNAKDIASINFTPNKTGGAATVTVRLKSGEVISDTVVAYTGKNSAWLVCDRERNCPTGKYISDNNYQNSMGGALEGVYVNEIENPRTIQVGQVTFSGNPKYNVMSDYRVIPSISDGTEEIRFLDETKRVTIKNRISSLEKSYDDADNQRREEKKKADEERESKIKAETADLRKHVHVGSMTNCGEVFDVRLPMVGVQTTVGTQYINISKLYGPSAECLFVNGRYVGRQLEQPIQTIYK